MAELGSLVGAVPALHDAIKFRRPLVWRVTPEPCRLDAPPPYGEDICCWPAKLCSAFPVPGHRFVERGSAASFFAGRPRVAGLVVHEAGVQRRLAGFAAYSRSVPDTLPSRSLRHISALGRNCQYSNMIVLQRACPVRPLIDRLRPLMGTLETPVSAHRSLASKHLI
jgi:hypothetical protein